MVMLQFDGEDRVGRLKLNSA